MKKQHFLLGLTMLPVSIFAFNMASAQDFNINIEAPVIDIPEPPKLPPVPQVNNNTVNTNSMQVSNNSVISNS